MPVTQVHMLKLGARLDKETMVCSVLRVNSIGPYLFHAYPLVRSGPTLAAMREVWSDLQPSQ